MSPLVDNIQLPEELGMYVDEVRKRYPAIDQVWILSRPADVDHGPEGVWELLVFGDESVLTGLRKDADLRRDDVDLLVVTDGDTFASAWGARPPGKLTSMGWRVLGAQSAAYSDGRPERAVATRVR